MTWRRARFFLAFLAGLVLVASHGTAQQARDPAAPYQAVGTGMLAGTVVTDESPTKPLRRAIVTLNESGGAIVSRLATSDDLGRFTFSGLPAGKYTVTASRPPFLRGSYGAHRMVSPASTVVGTTIPLANGQQVTGLTIYMQPGAAISGTIRDVEGQPAAGASVNAWYYQWISGTRTLVSSGAFTQTDDRGMYRIYGLAPGEYVMVAVPGGPRQVELMTVTDAEVRRAMDLIQRPPGTAPASPPPQSSSPPQTVGWAPVFYPGTTDVAQASPIRVATGEDRGGADVQIQLVPTSRAEGVVIGPDGAPAPGLQVRLVAANGVTTEPGLLQTGQTTTDRQGRFTLNSFAPGAYAVQAGSYNSSPMLFGSADVVLQGQLVTVTVTLAPLPAVTGRVVFEGASLPPEMSKVRVAVSRLVSGPPFVAMDAVPLANGDFTIASVIPDRYRVSITQSTPVGATWIIKSAIVNGQDVADRPFDIRSASSMVVTMTDRTTELSGRVTNAADLPVPDYYVIVFAADRALWTPITRRIQIALPEHDGRFIFRNLPPGDYRMAAATEVQQGEWLNPDFLTQLIDTSIKVVVPDGGRVVQEMRIR